MTFIPLSKASVSFDGSDFHVEPAETLPEPVVTHSDPDLIDLFKKDLRSVSEVGRIDPQKAQTLLAKAKASGDPADREALILMFSALPLSFLRRNWGNLDQNDVVGEGLLAVVEAVDQLLAKPSKKSDGSLVNLVWTVVHCRLIKASSQARTIRLKGRRPQQLRAVAKAKGKLQADYSLEDIAKESGLSVGVVRVCEQLAGHDVSLDAPIIVKGEQAEHTLVDVLPNHEVINPEKQLATKEQRQLLVSTIKAVLTPTLWRTFAAYFGLPEDGDTTQWDVEELTTEELGQRLNALPGAVRQRLKSAYKRLRNVPGLQNLLRSLIYTKHSGNIIPKTDAIATMNPKRKFTDDQVREIRRRSAAGETTTALGKAFGCSSPTISEINLRRIYRDVK